MRSGSHTKAIISVISLAALFFLAGILSRWALWDSSLGVQALPQYLANLGGEIAVPWLAALGAAAFISAFAAFRVLSGFPGRERTGRRLLVVALCLVLAIGGNGSLWALVGQPAVPGAGGIAGAPSCTYEIFLQGDVPAARSGAGQSVKVAAGGQDLGSFVDGLVSSNESLCFDAGSYTLATGIRVVGLSNVSIWSSQNTTISALRPLRLLQIVNSTGVAVVGGRWVGPGLGTFADLEIDKGSNHVTIEGVDASRAGHDGILIRNDTLPNLRVSILNNYLHNNGRYGFQDFETAPTDGLEILVSGNRAEDNVDGGIYTNGVGGAKIVGNSVRNTAGNLPGLIGIGVTNGGNDAVTGNRVDHMFWYGIQVFYNNHTLVANNYAGFNAGDSDQSGITNDHSFYDEIVNNTVESNGLSGVHVERSWYVNVTSNVATGNGRFGIEFYHGDMPATAHGDVSGNVCSHNGQAGIILNSGLDFDIFGNACFDNGGSGILLYNDQGQLGSSGNRIAGNRIGNDGNATRAQSYGVREMNQADDNIISSNILVQNAVADISLVGQASSTAGNTEEPCQSCAGGVT